ncbi:unnamed protein product [Brassica oleracea]
MFCRLKWQAPLSSSYFGVDSGTDEATFFALSTVTQIAMIASMIIKPPAGRDTVTRENPAVMPAKMIKV